MAVKKVLIPKKWYVDPPPPWVLLDKRFLDQFHKIDAEFDKKFQNLMKEKINKVNGIR